MAPVISAANIRAVAPETMEATSVALPEENTNDTSTTVKVAEEEANGAVTYWWGTASQATAKIGGAITKISDRHSVIFDSPIEEGYENKKTSSYFEINTNYAAFDMANQDLMFYIELPEAASSLRMKHICADGWGKWPKPEGMKYRYLAADGTTWQEGVIAAENEVKLTPGFKGWVRLLLNTATNCETYQNASIELQFFAFRIGAFGGSYGPAKLGGVWFVSKGEAYKVSVDGGSAVSLTTAEPQPSTGGDTVEEPAWTGDVMTGNWFTKEWNDAGSDSSLISVSDPDKFAGIATQATSRSTSAAELTGGSSRVFGLDKISIVDSPVKEGYFCDENKTYPIFTVSCAWKEFDLSKQDVMFYLELPAESSSIRFTSIYCNSGSNFWPQFRGMQMQYLSLDSLKWVASIPDANGQLNLPQGFKGYVRMKLDTATNASSFPGMTAKIVNFAFRPDRIGGDYGALKFGAAWFVTKEDTRYVKMDGSETSRLSDPAEPTWLSASVPNQETAEVGQTSAWLTWSDKGWGAVPEVTLTAGKAITPIGTQKSVLIESPKLEGYKSGGTKNSFPIFKVNMNSSQLNIAEQDVMFYLELPAGTTSIRLDGISLSGGTMTPGGGDLPYQYLAMDSKDWVDGVTDANKQINLTDGFRGYVRLRISEANGWWWLNHDNDDSWKTTTRPMENFTFHCERFGGEAGALKFGGVWFVSKENFTDISVNGADAVAMTTHAASEPVMQASSVAMESDPVTTWDSKVSYTDNDSWKTVDSKAQITLGESITRISSRKSVVIDSEIPEGYHNDGTTTWPMFRIATSASMNADEQDLMFYVELPATMSSLRIQDVTCRGWKFWLAPGNMQFKYLAMDSNDWVEGTISNEGNKQINLPQGFKGYIRLVLSSASNYSELGENAASLWIDALHFRAERFGGGLGALKLGGVWFVSKTDTYMVSVDGGEAVKMTDAPDPVDPSEPSEPSEPEPPVERDYLLGSMVSQESADIGAASTLIDINKNEEFWGIASQTTATAADGITIIGEQKSVTIDSPIEEGYGNRQTSPLYYVSCGWKELDTTTQDLMFYIELPDASSSIRVWDITCNNWSFWIAPGGMKYQYLEMDSNKWLNGAITNEDNKQLDLPAGFKGYVRLQINTAGNVDKFPAATLQIQSFSFRGDTFGGDNGPIKLGGVWFVSKEEYIKIKVNDGEILKMTNASDPGPVDPVDPIDPVDPDDPNRDYIIGSIPARETAANGKTSRLISMNDSTKWWGIPTQSTLVAGDPITIIGNQKSVIFDSPILEGYENKRTSALYTVNCGWTDLNLRTQDVMFYIEMPTSGRGSSGLRLWDLACDNYTFWVNTRGMKYQYLSMDSKEWVDGQIGTDDNKQIDLPDGFKGYVRLKVDTAANTADKETLKIQSFSFRPGTFGAEYGPIKFGGVWFVTKENFCYIRVDGAAKKVMTTYWQHNDELLDEFRELIEKLTDKDLSAAPTVDRLQSLYESMSKEYREKVTREELNRLNEYAAVIAAYRPEFIGATLKKYGSRPQSAKIGWTVDETLAKKGGYKVVSSGSVMIFGRSYDGKSLIDETTPASVKMTGKTASGYYYATTDIEAGDYKQAMLLRCYVIYEDSKTGKQYTVWCGMYTDKSGQTTPYMKCSLYEVAAYFGVPLYAN